MPFIRAKTIQKERMYIDNPKCIHMLETLRCPALNRCPVRAWHAVQTSFLLEKSHFGLLCSYRIFLREKILVISTTKQIVFHLITCCCIITSTRWELPTDQVHHVATGLAKVQHWLGAHTVPLAERSVGLHLQRLIGTGIIHSSMNKGLQPGSQQHELFILNENRKEK